MSDEDRKIVNWPDFRRLMPVVRDWVFMDHAAVSPLPAPARDAIVRWAGESADCGNTVSARWTERIEEIRATAASLFGASPDEVALVPNTTAGISLVAEGVPWRPGDNVVTLADEFPSNQYPWMNLADRGVETRRVPVDGGRVDLDRLAGACDSRTRIVSVSWVGYAGGYRIDVDEVARLAHDRGALLFLDAIQGLGVFPLDVGRTPVDFLAADGHKWLLGPEGAGFFYLRREHLDLLRPLGVGWHSVNHAHDFTHIELDLKQAAQRYEGGTQNMLGFAALGASVELLLSLGTENIADRILEIGDLACRRLEGIGAEIASCRDAPHASGIVSFDLPGSDPQLVKKRLLARGVVASCRGGRLRISPHAYNDSGDVDRLVEAVEDSR